MNSKSAAPSTGAVASCEAQASGEGGDRPSVEGVRITQTGRGFHVYGDDVVCTYGTRISVYESSSAEGPHVWLNLSCDLERLTRQSVGEGTAHLSEEQARAVVARLQTWLDEIPTRWDRPQRPVEGTLPDPTRSPAGDAAGQEVAGHPTQGEQGEGHGIR